MSASLGSLFLLSLSLSLSVLALSVGGANGPPVIAEAVLPDAVEDVEYNFTFTATDPDDPPAMLSWSDDSPLFDINTIGRISFTPQNVDVGLHDFNVTVSDPGGLTDIRAFTLYVANVNDRPELASIPPQFADPGRVFTLDVSKYVTDPDLLIPLGGPYDHLTYRDDTIKLSTDVGTGVVTWDAPTLDDVGVLRFKITVQDIMGRYDEQMVNITVNNTSSQHVILYIPQQDLHQDYRYKFDVPVSHPQSEVPSGDENLTFSNDRHELFVIDPSTGRIQFRPVNTQVGLWMVNITLTDQNGAVFTRRVVFYVQNMNDWPGLALIMPQKLVEGVPFVLQVRATDPDMEPRLLDGRAVDPQERLVFSTNSIWVLIDPVTGIINFTPTNDDAMLGDIKVGITVADLWGETSTTVVLFHVLNINDPPTNLTIAGVVPGQHLREGQMYRLSGNATDIDNAPGQLSYTWYTENEFVGEGRTPQWKVEGHGRMTLELRVTDNAGGFSKISVTVEVEPARPSLCPAVVLAGFVVLAAVTVALARRRRRH